MRQEDGVERPLRRIANSAAAVSVIEITLQSDGSLRSTRAIAVMVFQLRVVTETP